MAECEGKSQINEVKETVSCGICLQLLHDPRSLRCAHTYCLVCLQGFQTSSDKKECPACRAMTVPGRHDLHRLPINKLAVNLVSLVHTHDPSTALEAPPEWNTSTSKGPLAINNGGDRATSRSARLATLMSLVEEAVATDGGDGRPRHPFVTCDNCGKDGITGARYKCGICDDYDLCEECERKPRGEVHDIEHIFVKLKKPNNAFDTEGSSVLHEDSTVMGMTMNTESTVHCLEVPGGDRLETQCSKCSTSPITGIRYKCGVCEDYNLCEDCEKTSEEFHDAEHAFLVLRHPVGLHTTIPQLLHKFYK